VAIAEKLLYSIYIPHKISISERIFICFIQARLNEYDCNINISFNVLKNYEQKIV